MQSRPNTGFSSYQPYNVFSYPSTFPAVKPIPCLTGDLSNIPNVFCKRPNSKLVFIFLPCQRTATDNLAQRGGRKGMPLAGRQPQSTLCLQNSGQPHFGDHGTCLCFSATVGRGYFFALSSCHPQGNHLFIIPFFQVPMYLLSVYHVPSIVLIMVNTGDTRVIKSKSLPYGTSILEGDINKKINKQKN